MILPQRGFCSFREVPYIKAMAEASEDIRNYAKAEPFPASAINE
jgi:hypothetical protein